jgi:hypothetical protein
VITFAARAFTHVHYDGKTLHQPAGSNLGSIPSVMASGQIQATLRCEERGSDEAKWA